MVATRTLAAAVLAVALLTSGCVGFLTGDESLAFSASAASVEESTLSETGYEEVRSQAMNQTRNVTVADQTRTVQLSTHLRGYAHDVEVPSVGTGQLASFTVLATPAVDVAGQTFNPLGQLSNEELVNQVTSGYEGLGDVRRVGNRTVTSLGEEREVTTYASTMTVEGTQMNVFIDVATVEHDGDYLIVVAVHPAALSDEQGRVDSLLGGLQH